MTATDQDSLHRFLFDDHAISGKLVHLDATWRAVLERCDYPPVVREALGQAIAATALLASTLKFDGALTLQLQGDGPLRLLVAQCTERLTVRGLAQHDEAIGEGSLAELTAGGRLSVTIGTSPRAYQGIVPLQGGSIAECLQAYFDTSEQLPTKLWLAASESSAAGMLLQRLPVAAKIADADAWNRVTTLAGTVTSEELFTLSDRQLIRRLFHEEDVRLFESTPVAFRCQCSRGRVETVLKAMGRDEVASILAEQGRIEVRCEFCNRAYHFDRVDAELLLAELPPPVGPRRTH